MTSTSKKIRIAMIGAGAMANSVHYPSLASFEDVEIAAVCDLDEDRLKTTAKKYAIRRTFKDYRKMVEVIAPDGVYAIGMPHIMYDVWLWCLQEKQNLYIEKPMGLTWHQAQILAELAEKSGVITQVSHQRRSCPLLVEMRKKCLERGPITHAVCEFFKCQIQPQYSALDHMMEDCTHSIDTLRWMCGGEVAEVNAGCKRIGTPDINWIGGMIHFDNGSTGMVINSWSSGRRVFRVQMHAPNIYVDAEVEGKAHLYADGDYEGVEYDTKQAAGSDEVYVYGGFQAKTREFIDSLIGDKEVTTSPFRDCLKTMEVANEMLGMSLMRGD